MNELPLFAKPDDFKNYFGIDLAEVLRSSDNDSNYPFIFMRMVQDFLIDWCDESGFRRVRFDHLTPYQISAFRKAILYQTYYAWKNGSVAIGLDSGYDAERGTVVPTFDLKRTEVPDRVITLLHKAGLFNLKMKNRPRITRGYPGIGTYFEDI